MSEKLPMEKLAELDITISRYLRQLEGDAWRDEPTLLGWSHVEMELAGVVPAMPGAIPTVEL